jgi:hypothetical protein
MGTGFCAGCGNRKSAQPPDPPGKGSGRIAVARNNGIGFLAVYLRPDGCCAWQRKISSISIRRRPAARR